MKSLATPGNHRARGRVSTWQFSTTSKISLAGFFSFALANLPSRGIFKTIISTPAAIGLEHRDLIVDRPVFGEWLGKRFKRQRRKELGAVPKVRVEGAA